MLNTKNRALLNAAKAFHLVAGVRSVRLESSSICQLKCPKCPTGSGANAKSVIGSGFLRFADFKRLVDNHPKIRLIELSNYGEIFLNPELFQILEYAYRRRVHITALNGVNLNDIEPEVLEALVKFRVKAMTLSIDGATGEVYRMYRRNGDFNRVLHHVEQINLYKKKYDSRWPVLRWQFVVFDHNAHEQKKAKQMARELGALFYPKPCWDEPDRRPENSGASGTALKKNASKKQDLLLYCAQFWYQPQINWDGKLLGCCVNHFKDFGNVFSDGLDDIMSSENYKRTWDILHGRVAAEPESPCCFCPIYKKLRID